MSVFLDACHRRPTPYTPIWLMRQAGRYQASYRAIREKVGFMELCRSPELCSEVAVRAVDDLGVDAAIVFSDILVVLEPLGVGFEFTKDDGPRIDRPVRTAADVDRVASDIDPAGSLDYVMRAVRATKRDLGGRVPLLGFAGAPFTLASYVIEGGSSRDYLNTKRLMMSDEGAWNALLGKIADAVTKYLFAKVEAGADAVQLFDSWVGALSPRDYRRYVLPHTRRVLSALKGKVPTIHFGTGNPALLPAMREAGGDVIGLDQRAPLGESWDRLGEVAVMGNLDPVSLLAEEAIMQRETMAILDEAAGRLGHVFNLGHGVLPPTDVARARALVDFVHEESQKRAGPRAG